MLRSSFNIDPLKNAPLSAGVYPLATRAAFSSPLAGLSFTGNGQGCNTSSGSFNVYEIEFNNSNQLIRLTADFKQYCGNDADPIRGSINLDLTPAI